MNRIIVAIDRKRGLAKHGFMPWNIPEDEQYFTDQTKTHGGIVLTGGTTFRNTYHNKPLAGRQNYILTHNHTTLEGATPVHDLQKFLRDFENNDVWIAGGAKVFQEIMQAGGADELYITHIDADFGCDQFFPEYESKFTKKWYSKPHEQNGFHFTYTRYTPR